MGGVVILPLTAAPAVPLGALVLHRRRLLVPMVAVAQGLEVLPALDPLLEAAVL